MNDHQEYRRVLFDLHSKRTPINDGDSNWSETTKMPGARRAPRVALSQHQIASYRENGYLRIEQFANLEEVERLRAILEKMFADRAGRDRGLYVDVVGLDEEGSRPSLPQILYASRLAPALRRTVFLAQARIIARQLLGPDAEFLLDHALLKPARGEEDTPWHQDMAFSDARYDHEQVTFWLPLQEVTVDNGCLQFIPRRHLEILLHRSPKDDPRLHGLECFEGFDPGEAVACPLPVGGVSLHDGLVLHGAGPNRSDQPRFAYVATFATPSRRLETPRHFPWNDEKRTAGQERERKWIEKSGLPGAVVRHVRRKIEGLRRRVRKLSRMMTTGWTQR
jgi:ectoine hydroxylase-related dioxygenase (phytanoyl-CoA dioxygenase family)